MTSRLADLVALLVLVSLLGTVLMLPLALITNEPWWTGAVLGPVLAATLVASTTFTDGLSNLAERRQRTRRAGSPPVDQGLWERVVGWSADHQRAARIAAAVLLLVGFAWATSGWGWALAMVGFVGALHLAWRGVQRVARQR